MTIRAARPMTDFNPVKKFRGLLSLAVYPLLGRAVAWACRDQITAGECVVDTASPYITPATKARLFLGRYEAPELRFIRQCLPRDLDVVELGASIGVTTVHIARRLAPDRRLICVEANPHLLPLLHATLTRNVPGRAVTVLHQAIDYSGAPTARLDVSATNTNSRLGAGSGLAVEATTLSALIRRFGLGPLALVADIEGAELGLLLHDAPALQQVQHLLIELHACGPAGDPWSPARMRAALLHDHHFVLQAAFGPVCVFSRPIG